MRAEPREILFRGQDVYTGDWLYGAFQPEVQETLYGYKRLNGYILAFSPSSGKTETREVERESVGQYTGVRDTRGTMIFEGDVLRICDDTSEWYAAVEFGASARDDDYSWGWQLRYITGTHGTEFVRRELLYHIGDEDEACEVVGNTYRNDDSDWSVGDDSDERDGAA